MSTNTRKSLGELVRHVVTLAAGESASVQLDSTLAGAVSLQVTVAAGDSATAHGSCDDTAPVVAEDAFPLFGEDGVIAATTAKRTACMPFPGPLRTVFLSADADNTGTVRVVVLQ
jgi:hypothetical protein